MTEYDVYGEEKSCLVCGGSHCLEEWSYERAVESESEQRLCGVGLVVRRRIGCLRIVGMITSDMARSVGDRRL